MKVEITLNERKAIQLEMLTEIESFCKDNNIRYSLAFGTLIGAIRHHGYIPWDDDVDIMMPLPDMIRFKSLFKSEKLKYCDVDTEKYYEYHFSRISYLPTYRRKGILLKQYGVSIDLYPVIGFPDSHHDQETYFNKLIRLYKKRIFFINWRDRICRRFPINTIPGFTKAVKVFRDYTLYSTPKYGTTNTFFIHSGPPEWRKRLIFKYDLFKEMTTIEFEGKKLSIISCYHDYLTQFYGDYMQLPPVEERIPNHGGHFFWR